MFPSKSSTQRTMLFFLPLLVGLLSAFLLLPFGTSLVASTPPGPTILSRITYGANHTQVTLRPKVFVIGLSRTGTTSLGDAVARLGYRRSGWVDVRSHYLFQSWTEDNLYPLIEHTKLFDAFEDIPWAMVYKEMATIYPDSKFIMTLRKSEEAWLKSMIRHTELRKWDGHGAIYGAVVAENHEKQYLEAYRNHTESVRAFFGSRDKSSRLLEFVIDDAKLSSEERWATMVDFLELGESVQMEKLGEFPRTNGAGAWINSEALKPWHRFLYAGQGVLMWTVKRLAWLTSKNF